MEKPVSNAPSEHHADAATTPRVRAAHPTEIASLARLWFDAWRDAHADIAPPELTRARTLERFAERIEAALPELRVVGAVGDPLGFHLLKGDELYQLFVAGKARGTGVAQALIADAERLLAERGVEVAWLACAIGNERAARFYEKSGWHRAGIIASVLELPEGPMTLEVWRYEKALRSS